MKISIVVVAYNAGLSIHRLFRTALADSDKHDIKFRVFSHSMDPETLIACDQAVKEYGAELFGHGENRGLARSWNDGILHSYSLGDDVVIVCNDDIYFTAGDVDKIARKAITSPKNYMISAAGWHEKCQEFRPSQGYSCFAINPIALDKIGCFDENLWPAYFEDTDHHRRANMQDLYEENCLDTNVVHDGSMSVDRDMANLQFYQTIFHKNMEYFLRKWNINDIKGGFKTPFNEPKFNLYISPDNRHHPYGPGYDRIDIPRRTP